MAHVINRNYSKFYDVRTRVQFEPVLDGAMGTHVAHAQTGADFEGRAGFEVLSDGEYLALISAPTEKFVKAGVVSSGDPVRDASVASKRGGTRSDASATSDSREGRLADGREPLIAGDLIDPESAAASQASMEGAEAGGHD